MDVRAKQRLSYHVAWFLSTVLVAVSPHVISIVMRFLVSDDIRICNAPKEWIRRPMCHQRFCRNIRGANCYRKRARFDISNQVLFEQQMISIHPLRRLRHRQLFQTVFQVLSACSNTMPDSQFFLMLRLRCVISLQPLVFS